MPESPSATVAAGTADLSLNRLPATPSGGDLRNVMRFFATGVCVVTTFRDEDGGRRHDAVTMNSLSSVSLEPPLVSLSLRRDSSFLADLLGSGLWGVSILDADGEPLARSFARRRCDRTATDITARGIVGGRTGVLLYPAAGWMECRYRSHFQAGDHVVVLGEVLAHGSDGSRPPLIFVHGGYHVLEGSHDEIVHE